MKPKRIQLKRTKGWRMPPNTVKVDRSTQWGNPHKTIWLGVCWGISTSNGDGVPSIYALPHMRKPSDKQAVSEISVFFHETDLMYRLLDEPDFLEPLRGKNLACWCKEREPCHADILLELANRSDE